MICRQCGATLEEKQRCECIETPTFLFNPEHLSAFRDLLDYLDDRIAPALISDSVSIIFDEALYSLQDVGNYIFRWAKAKEGLGEVAIEYAMNSALISFEKLYQYGMFSTEQIQSIIPTILIVFYEKIDPECIEKLKNLTTWIQRKFDKIAEGKSNPTKSSETILQKEVQLFEKYKTLTLQHKDDIDDRLSEGEPEISKYIDSLIKEVSATENYEQFANRTKDLKRIVVELLNHEQLFTAWKIADSIHCILKSRDKETSYRIIYESTPANVLDLNVLRSFSSELIFHPLLKPIIQLFAEFNYSELFLALLHESDQGVRHLYYNLLKIHGEEAIPSILNELHNTTNSPWYYIRNIINVLGELSPFAENMRRKSLDVLQHYVTLTHHRQVVLSALIAVARISGHRAERILTDLLYHYDPPKGIYIAEDAITKREFAAKIIESLCLLGSETSIKEVIEIVFGKRIYLSDQQTAFASAVQSLSRLDLSIYPLLYKETISKVVKRIVEPSTSIKNLIFRRDAKEDSAILQIFRHTRGTDPEALLQSVINSKAAAEVKETARIIIDERKPEGIMPTEIE